MAVSALGQCPLAMVKCLRENKLKLNPDKIKARLINKTDGLMMSCLPNFMGLSYLCQGQLRACFFGPAFLV